MKTIITPIQTTLSVSRKAVIASSSIVLAVLLVTGSATAGGIKNAHAVSPSSCNCVVFRLDDIQDDWIHNVQATVMDTFINTNTPLTPALEMNFYGSDPVVVDKVSQGQKAGLFELALHGWNHVDYSQLSLADQQSTLAMANDKLQTIHGVRSNIFITPYNAANADTLTAMKNDNLTIMSADLFDDNGFLAQTFPPADPSGIISLPYTVWYIQEGKPEGANGKTADQLHAEINDSLAKWGWAVVMVHPQDFAKFDSNGEAQDELNSAQLATLQSLIADVKADGTTITSFNGLVALTPSQGGGGPDTQPPAGTIASPAAESSVPLGSEFTVSGTASDNVAVSNVEVRAVNSDDTDGTDYAQAETTDNFAHWTFALTIPDGTFDNIEVRITDSSGNQQWLSEHVNLTGSPPPQGTKPLQVTITAPTAGSDVTLGSTVTVTGTASDSVAALSMVEVRAATPDDSVGTEYAPATLSANGQQWSINLPMTNPAYTTIVARATDASGNQQWDTIAVSMQ